MTRPLMIALAALVSLSACKDKESIPETRPEDSGTSAADDTGAGEVDCTAMVESSEPLSGTIDHYYRDPVEVLFTEDASSASFALADSAGTDAAITVSWGEGNLRATVTPDEPLSSSTEYILDVDACGVQTLVGFTTSEYGENLEFSPKDLIGNTYYFDLAAATYEKPVGLGGVIGTYLDAPLLVGIMNASDTTVSVMGAQGAIDKTEGVVYQDEALTTWDFGEADFTQRPYFETDSDEVVIDYNGTLIPLYDFHLEGTFSADGQSIGGGSASGLGDTRELGPLLGQGDEKDSVCDLASDLGIECEICPDGGPYCLYLLAFFDRADVLDGVTLVEIK